MKFSISTIVSQIYLIPYIKITYDRYLNGDLKLKEILLIFVPSKQLNI